MAKKQRKVFDYKDCYEDQIIDIRNRLNRLQKREDLFDYAYYEEEKESVEDKISEIIEEREYLKKRLNYLENNIENEQFDRDSEYEDWFREG